MASEHSGGETPLSGDGGVFGDGDAVPANPVAAPVADTGLPKQVDSVLYSEIGINTLLNRLKQSIASAKDFAAFLKKRSSIEEDHAQGLRRLAKSTQENIHSQAARQGSYVNHLEEVMKVHERLADNGMQFALSVHQMHEDLTELSNNMEKGRKHWKHEGLNAEKRASDAETMMDKAKAKYYSLAEDYDRARTGDAKAGRRIGIKGPKSAAQHEEDLLRKLQAADSDYQQKVHTAKAQREELFKTARPQAIRALQELITETDSGLTLQLQKYATFNEKLLLGNGLAVSPLPPTDASLPPQHSMRDMVSLIDNDKDVQSFILNHYTKVPARPSEIKYDQHPTLLPKQTAAPFIPAATLQEAVSPQQAPPVTYSSPGSQPQHYDSATTGRDLYNNNNNNNSPVVPPKTPSDSPYNTGYTPTNHTAPPYPQSPPTHHQQQASYPTNVNPPYPSSGTSIHNFPTAQSPGAGSVPVSAPAPASAYGAGYSNGLAMGQQQSSQSPPQTQVSSPQTGLPPPLKPVFGVSLEELFRRDGTAVPMVVYQCMQAVDLFGLDMEGIYRVSPTASHVQQMKAQFDHDSSAVDFRNPAAFYHDVNSVAGLLKQFFRDLPDPLLTTIHYSRFIDAARLDDDVVRRDSIHAVINDLPDAHYATLRALVLHLSRVLERSDKNRMNAGNLAICFAPTLMGSHTGPMIADAGLQARVLDTILANTYQIFDED